MTKFDPLMRVQYLPKSSKTLFPEINPYEKVFFIETIPNNHYLTQQQLAASISTPSAKLACV